MNADTTAGLGFALLGLMLGIRHATDPDHVIAVTTILSRERRFAAATRVGIVWGVGHTLTVLAVGTAIIVFKLAVPARLGLAMEFAVAIVLILLGLSGAAGFIRQIFDRFGTRSATPDTLIVHAHRHNHDGAPHSHPHVHSHPHDYTSEIAETDALHNSHVIPDEVRLPFASRRPMLRSFGVGLVHGLAGSAAIALIVLSAIPEPLWATLYLAVFCLGTIVGMALITTAIAMPFIVASQRMAWLHRGLVTGSGLLSLGFGLFLAYEIGIADGLFGSVVIWTPR
jgi:ABC-type nickel/cobalt efflux system permease component RcnA